jgi:deoxycytidylate deaminase
METEVIKLPSDTVYKAAQKEAKKSKAKFKHGAVIFRGARRVLSKGYNIHKTDPSFGSGEYKMLHAEGSAIKEAVRKGIDIFGASIYVFRLHDNMSKPCKSCQQLIDKFGIKEIIYSRS